MFIDLLMTVLNYLKNDWYILLFGSLIAVIIKVYFKPDKIKNYISKKSKLSIITAILFGIFTPLCACGTMAVLISMFVTALPWGPAMAFLVSSPLTSPDEFYFESVYFGSTFAIAVLISSIILGLSAGFISHILDKKTLFFKDQFRYINHKSECSQCNKVNKINKSLIEKIKLKELFKEFYSLGIKKILLLFILFVIIGRIAEMLIPAQLITNIFSESRSYSVLVAGTIGLPLYLSGPSSIPLMKVFLENGASQGALLAFLITGKATGIPVIAGMMTIVKKRTILFYVLTVYIGGIVLGYLYQFLLYLI